MVVLDTDHISLLQQPDSDLAERLARRLDQLLEAHVATSIVTYEEQTRGWLGYAAKAKTLVQIVEAYGRLSRSLDAYRKINVLKFDEISAVEFQRLQKLKLRIGTMDLRIAAIALANSATVLTRNLKDFNQVPGLSVEDWTE